MTTTLIEQLQDFPAQVARFVAAFPPARLCERPAAGGFSLVEHLCHLRDLEREGYLQRIRRILDENLPELAEIDGSTLAVERDYQRQDPAAALRDWQSAREQTVLTLREHLPRAAQRKGIYGGFGVITLAALSEGIAAHDRAHWAELLSL